MTNGKSNREKLVKGLATAIILIILSVSGINISDIISDTERDRQPSSNVPQQVSNNLPVEGELILTMIDCGQADSFLFIQNGEIALIDSGTRSTGKDVVEYLKSIGIEKIDYLFGTHPHDDHMGGMYDIIMNFEIGKIILPKVKIGEMTTNWYMKLMQEIKNGGYGLEYAELGNIYNLGDASMKVIGPISEPEDNLNNYSTVLKVSFGEMDIIMTGDAEREVEQEILASGEDIDAEILKIGHHGSSTSSSKEFLDAVTPDYALISAKLGNKFEHPTEDTMKKLKNRDIAVYRTDENGTVVLTITANDASFNCEAGDYLSGTELEERMTK